MRDLMLGLLKDIKWNVGTNLKNINVITSKLI